MYYGAAPSETDAIRALAAVNAEAYSFGQPNVDGGHTLGAPDTFILAFADVGGAPLYTPVAQPDSLTALSGSPATVDVRINDTDPNNEALTVTGSTNGQHGTISCTPAGACTYTSTVGYVGPDQFTYTVANNSGGTATGTVTVNVTPATNHPPTVSAGTDVSSTAGIPIELKGTANDPEGNPLTLTWTIISVDHPGTKTDCKLSAPTVATTQVTCDQPGTYTATLAASDGTNPAVTDQATVTVKPAPTGCTGGSVQTELPLDSGFLTQLPGHTLSGTVDVNLPCGGYHISLTSGDPGHAAGYQPDQTGEQWVLEGVDATGKVIYTSPVTPDLPEDEKIATFDVGNADLTGVVKLRGRHAGTSGTVNSIHYLAVNLTPADQGTSTCSGPAVTVNFPLDSHLGPGAHRYSHIVPVSLTCHRYALTMSSGDEGHAPGYQTDQTHEQWILEGLDATGAVKFTSAPTPDLPEDQKAASFDMGQIDLTGVTQLRARHADFGTGENSVHQASVTLRPVG